MRPTSHALPAAPPPARTTARSFEVRACLVLDTIPRFPDTGANGNAHGDVRALSRATTRARFPRTPGLDPAADRLVFTASAGCNRTDVRAPFDVFLSHNSRDKPLVERLAERLKRTGLEPWLDVWCLVPGADWQRGLSDGLARSGSCAVFVGPFDLGAWANQEVAVALDRAAKDPDFRLFLVLLPGLPEASTPRRSRRSCGCARGWTTVAGWRTSAPSRRCAAR